MKFTLRLTITFVFILGKKLNLINTNLQVLSLNMPVKKIFKHMTPSCLVCLQIAIIAII